MKKTFLILAVLSMIFSATALAAESEDMQLTRAGVALFKAGQYEEAIAKFEDAIVINPDNYYAFQYSGMAYLQSGDKDTALLQFERANMIYPNPKMKKYIDDLKKTVRRSASFSFYPWTFDADISLTNGMLYGNNATLFSSGSFFSNFGAVVLVNYNINEWFSVTSGGMYTKKTGGLKIMEDLYYSSWNLEYSANGIDIPLYARFRFPIPWSDKADASFGAGPYISVLTGAKGVVNEYFSSSSETVLKEGFASTESGVSMLFCTTYFFGKLGMNFMEILSFGLTDVHKDFDAKTFSFITTLGVSF